MARESEEDFKERMIEKMCDLGFVINSSTVIKSHGWTSVRDSQVDKPYEKSGRFKFDTAQSTGSPVCLFKSMRRDLPTDFKRGDLSIEYARGLSIDNNRPKTIYKEPTLAEKLTLDPIYRAEMQPAVAKVEELWKSSIQKDSHGYLKNPDINPARIRETQDGKLLIPVYRPTAPDLTKVELAGGQLITSSGFKSFIPGTKSGGGFALVPACSDPNKWLDHLSKSPKPLVLCEGVGTALAIHQSTGYPVIACLNAKNIPLIAEYLKNQNHTVNREVIICADNDLDIRRDGEPKKEVDKFIGIKEACKSAEIVGGKVAVVDNDKGGYDARDLFKDKGGLAVADLIKDARTVEQIKLDRPNIFPDFENKVELER